MKKVITIIMVFLLLVVLMLPCVAFAADGLEAAAPDFISYIVAEAYVLIPVLYILGVLFKKIPNIPDWVIPFALLIIGIPAAMALAGWTIEGAMQGVLITGVTVLSNQLYKQAVIKRE